ncbi:family 43 glycosylhydrolase [Paenibacillus swuensis]|uniref:family 43 glycosylhydrolase n=1 Tax=Paenibacillus swuensis TaxID=1178515 RepID=UPI0008396023|nr:family 43 glycosylhydrolase [Paenibacillus swuensis]
MFWSKHRKFKFPKTLIFALCLTMLLPGLVTPGASASAASTTTFTNPLNAEGPDPWIYYHTDGYYYYMRTLGDQLDIWRSRTLTGIDHGERKTVWTKPSGLNDIWAPEIHHLDGKWYIYYTANTGCGDSCRGVYVLENSSANPLLGTWSDKGKVNAQYAGLDGSVFDHAGKRYFMYAAYGNWPDYGTAVAIAEMSNPWTLTGPNVVLTKPEYAWEKEGGLAVNEGAVILKRNGKLNLVYSASACWSDNYALGMLTAPDTANPLSAASWSKASAPVFEKSAANNIYGPGHNSFVRSKDGTEDWIVYHANTGTGLGCSGRPTRTQKFTWNADGSPNFGAPAPVNTPLSVPSGEYRIEAEHATVQNAAISNKSAASGGKVVGYIDYADSSVMFRDVNVPAAGLYKVTVRYTNGSGATASHNVSVNGGGSFAVTYNNIGWDTYGTVSFQTSLNLGYNNTIQFTKGNQYAEIDSIDLELVSANVTSMNDNFDDGNANGWTSYGGTWAVTNSKYTVNSGGGHKAVYNGSSFSNVVYEGDVTITSGNGDAGLLFRATNPGNGADTLHGYYAAINTNGTVILGKMSNNWTFIASANMTVSTNTAYHMKVVASGSNIQVFVQDMSTPKLNVNDSSHGSGAVGVRVSNTAAAFDNLSAASL